MRSNREMLTCHYRYDPIDRLTAFAPSEQASTQRYYLNDRLATEIQGSVQRSIMQHKDQLLALQQRQSGTAQTRLLATDRQRSVLSMLNAKPPSSFAYTPYGHRPLGSGLLSLLGFNGERPDPVTGHYLLGNGYRAFNPVLLRFNSPDSWSPFGEGGLNAYAYCVGDPVNRYDPTGHVSPFFAKLFGAPATRNFPPTTQPALPPGITQSIPAAETNPSFFEGMLKTTKQALRRNSTPSNEPMSPARQHIENVTSDLDNSQPFINRLRSVNQNLDSHGNDSLSKGDALKYGQLAKQVDSGELSNTAAHASSVVMWVKKFFGDRSPSGVVGVFFNVGGAGISGAYDHGLQKTGKALRQPPSS
jgi:RHS repeat-associated protein